MKSCFPRLLIWAGAMTLAHICRSDSPAPVVTHITTAPSGLVYFKMVRTTYVVEGNKRKIQQPPFGIAYRLDQDGTVAELWRTDGWYAHEVYIGDDGHSLVRMGPWHMGSKPEPKDLAVAFYQDGKLLKEYSTFELVKDHSCIIRSVSHYRWLAEPSRRGDENPRFRSGDQKLTLCTVDNITYEFDLRSGEIIKVTTPDRDPGHWATVEDLDRLCVALAIADYPIPCGKEAELLGLPKTISMGVSWTYPPSVETGILAISPPDDTKGYYAIELAIENYNRKNEPPTGNIIQAVLMFISVDGHRFVYRPSEALQRHISDVKRRMREKNQTPAQASQEAMKGNNRRWFF